jgi:hypothetical protein
MGKITYNAAQVIAKPTYNWSCLDPLLGALDIGVVTTTGPGTPGSNINNVTTSTLPLPIFSPQLGQRIKAWEPTLGFGEFIFLQIPKSNALVLGNLVSWDSFYNAVKVPAKGTSQKTGLPVAVTVASTVYNSGNGVASNSTSNAYAWFQVSGFVQMSKTAIQVTPVAAGTLPSNVYISGTAGYVYATASAGGQLLGARFANTATVSTVASCIIVDLNNSTLEGF